MLKYERGQYRKIEDRYDKTKKIALNSQTAREFPQTTDNSAQNQLGQGQLFPHKTRLKSTRPKFIRLICPNSKDNPGHILPFFLPILLNLY